MKLDGHSCNVANFSPNYWLYVMFEDTCHLSCGLFEEENICKLHLLVLMQNDLNQGRHIQLHKGLKLKTWSKLRATLGHYWLKETFWLEVLCVICQIIHISITSYVFMSGLSELEIFVSNLLIILVKSIC